MFAEDEGRRPMSRAKVEVAAKFGCSQSIAEAALRLLHNGEWHHVGKYATEVAYYDAADERLGGVISHIKACGGVKKWAARREALKAERNGEPARYRDGGRIAAAAERRAIMRDYLHAALGREVKLPIDARNEMYKLWREGDRCDRCVARRAIASGWSRDAVLVALVSGHWEFIYRGHQAAANEIISLSMDVIEGLLT